MSRSLKHFSKLNVTAPEEETLYTSSAPTPFCLLFFSPHVPGLRMRGAAADNYEHVPLFACLNVLALYYLVDGNFSGLFVIRMYGSMGKGRFGVRLVYSFGLVSTY
ncbi:hypothetical protein AVEN_85204-1 [Araneus ventricosus]|uniref:Uncharacterized protein n=1 Tax=Araneus ventricosus TaxID=182803 RepID=A0A4Y2ECV1_ARAVE|nr:hypothetical protein AVEN_85204-1 [Araneus ventricosus]